MRRVNDKERGAVAVTVALLMVVVLGMAAIVIDLGMVYAERAQLQNGADAAAIAIAQDCANGHCGTYTSTATTLAGANANDGKANAQATINGAAHTVTVETSTLTSDNKTAVQHWFAPIIGVPQTAVQATATATWGSPIAGPATLPLTFSICQVKDQVPGALQLLVSHGSKADAECNYGSSGHVVPGNYGWLAQEDGSCGAVVDLRNDEVEGRPGASKPDGCDDLLSSWASDLNSGETVHALIPIFDETTGNGNGKTGYHLAAFAAFEVEGWKFSGGDDSPPLSFRNSGSSVEAQLQCTGSCRGIIGKFVEYVSLDGGYTLGPPNSYGATIVQLTS